MTPKQLSDRTELNSFGVRELTSKEYLELQQGDMVYSARGKVLYYKNRCPFGYWCETASFTGSVYQKLYKKSPYPYSIKHLKK